MTREEMAQKCSAGGGLFSGLSRAVMHISDEAFEELVEAMDETVEETEEVFHIKD